MRMYTILDMIRMSKLSKEVDLNPVELIKEFNKKFPEKSAKEQMANLKKALETVCECSGDMQNVDCKAGEDCYWLNK